MEALQSDPAALKEHMPNNFNNSPFGQPAGNQEAAGGQALVIITAALAASNLILLLTVFFIASGIQHRRVPPVPPSAALLLLFYAVSLVCLLGAVLRPRFQSLKAALLPHKEFSPQIFTSIGLVNVCQYLGVIWVILGGAFLPSVLFFVCPAAVTLLVILPVVRKRASLLKPGI